MIKKSEYIHEHYRDFGLINMNGRMYDPLVRRKYDEKYSNKSSKNNSW